MPKTLFWSKKPLDRSHEFNLTTGRMVVSIGFRVGTRLVKAKVITSLGPAKMVKGKKVTLNIICNANDDQGKQLYATVPVKVTDILVLLERDGLVTNFVGRSLCKDPDEFSVLEGIKMALISSFRYDRTNILSKSDRKTIMQAVCPWLHYESRQNPDDAITPAREPNTDEG